jgi:uncharacterized protein YbaR (Trm112 family)
MTRLCCPRCRTRFSIAATAFLTTCPECDGPLDAVDSAAATIGFRLFATEPQPALPMAGEAAVDRPRPDRE